MRRWLLGFCVVALLGFSAVAAVAVDVNAFKAPRGFMPTQKTCVLDSSLVSYGLATSYTIYGQDSTDVFYARAKFGATWTTVALTVHAGQSLTIPAPTPEYNSTDGYWRHTYEFTSQADSVLVIPWVK